MTIEDAKKIIKNKATNRDLMPSKSMNLQRYKGFKSNIKYHIFQKTNTKY